jgi:hypothetical protein
MKRIATAVDLVLLVGLLLLTIASAIRMPGAIGAASLIALLPYGMALLALKTPGRPAATWIAIGLNALLAIAGLVILMGGAAFPIWGVAISIALCVGPGVLNVIVLLQDHRLHRASGSAT